MVIPVMASAEGYCGQIYITIKGRLIALTNNCNVGVTLTNEEVS